MTTRTWKVYGINGHRQRESFGDSYRWDFSTPDGVRIISITRNTAEECELELDGQISDGIFENSRVGRIVEVKDGEPDDN